ncbi:hypothetical protein [Achromobacter kerstersii]|uniref:hypothetical protein n=1 Tax=Achromobacter kerstersii TaxID=1353890 RepID=UPI00313EB5A5
MHAIASQYPWAEELEKTVVRSLATSFGLDFLLFKDKHGGEVDTIHNARSGVWATQAEHDKYDQRGAYSDVKGAYHSDRRYMDKGKSDAALQQSGKLQDGYTSSRMSVQNGIRDLDHVIAAKTIHDDAGRVLADISGMSLANHSSNLVSTHRSINRSKQALPVEEFLTALPGKINQKRATLTADRKTLESMPRNTPEQRHRADQKKTKIEKTESQLQELESIDPAAMRKKDLAARKQYDGTINKKYYTSSKFWGSTLSASGNAGVRMGARQMLGLVAAEIWFELREALPALMQKMRVNFSLATFLQEAERTLQSIWTRVKARFKDFLTAFKDGAFAGILGSVTTTMFNIVATTGKSAIKIIREMWGQMTAALKLLVFNPDGLSTVDLTKAVVAALSAGVATAVGSLVYAQLVPIMSFPFGGELAAFIGALTTGIVTLGLHYVLLHSKMMERIWLLIERSSHALTLRQFETLNAQLDEYLEDIARIELNVDVDELEDFALDLSSAKTETARGAVLLREIKERGIALPYEMGNADSTRSWLASLAK